MGGNTSKMRSNHGAASKSGRKWLMVLCLVVAIALIAFAVITIATPYLGDRPPERHHADASAPVHVDSTAGAEGATYGSSSKTAELDGFPNISIHNGLLLVWHERKAPSGKDELERGALARKVRVLGVPADRRLHAFEHGGVDDLGVEQEHVPQVSAGKDR
jgi:hypothetical protein